MSTVEIRTNRQLEAFDALNSDEQEIVMSVAQAELDRTYDGHGTPQDSRKYNDRAIKKGFEAIK